MAESTVVLEIPFSIAFFLKLDSHELKSSCVEAIQKLFMNIEKINIVRILIFLFIFDCQKKQIVLFPFIYNFAQKTY